MSNKKTNDNELKKLPTARRDNTSASEVVETLKKLPTARRNNTK